MNLIIIWYLIAGHFLCDFPLQGNAIARYKNRNTENPTGVPWYYWLTAHALIHGGFVTLVAGSILLGLLESWLHWVIDFCKCEKWINIHEDQLLHIICKLIWFTIITLRRTL